MNKPVLGMAIGGVLGLFDGLSAWAYPEARAMMAAIVTGSVIKGIVTGLAAGLVARWWHSTPLGIGVGTVIGAGLSTLAAAGQPDHYWAIVLPGMLLGAVTGYVTQRYGSSGPGSTGTLPTLPLALMLLAIGGQTLDGQSPVLGNDLSSLEFFLGRWEGTTEGKPGKGTVSREYNARLQSKIFQATHRGVYPPQPANPKGEVHEDLGIYSFDASAKVIRFRQFHVEGFVVHYVHQPQTTPGTFVFVSEAIENIPAGYRSRETHVVIGPDEFEERFELAEPGKDFELYSRTRLTRAK
jgi:F0F1-type ATP synthase assembly protein I